VIGRARYRGSVIALTSVPWRKPRHEVLLLVLVAVTAFAPIYSLNPQDTTRTCLSKAITHARLNNDLCFFYNDDFSTRAGHNYSDKAPGLAVLELPAEVALGLPEKLRADGRLWLLRLFVVGSSFVACAFLVGRVTEGLTPGFGAVSLVTFALGTLMAPFAAANFDAVPAALIGLGTFLLAWKRRPFLAGLAGGAGILVEYQVGAVVAVVGLYVALTGWRPLARFAAGVAPGVLLLGIYDRLAFGSPWHLSYDYIYNPNFRHAQSGGILGVGVPHAYGSFEVFAGTGGILVASPVLVAAGCGLVLFGRTHRAEAVVCAVLSALFVMADVGYFLPYGGSPGPRFIIPGLPFVALGLGYAFARAPRTVVVLAAVSVAITTMIMLHWDQLPPRPMWAEIAHVPAHAHTARFVTSLERTAWDWVLPGRVWGAIVVGVCALAALIVGITAMPWEALRAARRRRSSLGMLRLAGVVLAVYAIGTAVVFSATGYPYGSVLYDLSVALTGTTHSAYQGQEVDFQLVVKDSSNYQGYGPIVLTIGLTPGMHLLGAPYYEHGSGCRGTTPIRCNLGGLAHGASTPVRLGVRITSPEGQRLTAWVHAPPNYHLRHPATFDVAIR
jgi:hypothetical protein